MYRRVGVRGEGKTKLTVPVLCFNKVRRAPYTAQDVKTTGREVEESEGGVAYTRRFSRLG